MKTHTSTSWAFAKQTWQQRQDNRSFEHIALLRLRTVLAVHHVLPWSRLVRIIGGRATNMQVVHIADMQIVSWTAGIGVN